MQSDSKRLIWLILMLAGAAGLAACSDESARESASGQQPSAAESAARVADTEQDATVAGEDAASQAATAAGSAAAGASGDEQAALEPSTEIHIEGNDQMQFNLDRFAVPAGEEITLTLEHTGQLPVNAMGHNVVILKRGEDVRAFGQRVPQAGGSLDNDHLPESMRDRVLAFTDMIGGGETTTVTFTAPEEPGENGFLCTFPAHYTTMSGVMVVK